jgi:UDP-2,3-diacylglucosamine hydrolase
LAAPPKLGVLAGQGALPARLAAAARAAGREVFVVAFEGQTERGAVAGFEHVWAPLAAVGRVLDALRAARCQELCLIGPLDRPDFAQLRPDWTGLRLLPRLIAAARRGDDALMSELVRFLEEQGFRVIGADAVFADLVMPAGAIGAVAPSESDRADIAKGGALLQALGPFDVGQAAVVREGLVLAVEAAEGTDAMLERCRSLIRERRGGVLVKLPKPGQELRVDLPTVGVATVAGAAAAGLNGIALQAGGALVVDLDAVRRAADEAALFVVGIEPGAQG